MAWSPARSRSLISCGNSASRSTARTICGGGNWPAAHWRCRIFSRRPQCRWPGAELVRLARSYHGTAALASAPALAGAALAVAVDLAPAVAWPAASACAADWVHFGLVLGLARASARAAPLPLPVPGLRDGALVARAGGLASAGAIAGAPAGHGVARAGWMRPPSLATGMNGGPLPGAVPHPGPPVG